MFPALHDGLYEGLRDICRGKRSGVYGAFLLAVFNAEGEEFQTISKIGTGFSEEQLKQFSEELKEHIIPTAKPYYRSVPIPFPACPVSLMLSSTGQA